MLKGKKIILGVTGSIAAYKAAMLVRLLVKAGATVQVIMTEAATDFISPLTLATLAKTPVLMTYQKDKQSGEWNNHVELGLWADLLLIAPCSANTLAKLANGFCDNLLTAVYLSARCPVWVAPAMDLDMYAHPATLRNLAVLQQFPNHAVIEATEGELASGLLGKGRMEEPEQIVAAVANYFEKQAPNFAKTENLPLKNVRVLLTAGGTREALDPVRFISNHSTGKMGYALATALALAGANVTLVSGMVGLQTPENVKRIEVVSAEDMYQVVMQKFENQDIIIHAAAVADYTPKEKSATKIKKNDSTLLLELVKTKDIAAAVGKVRRANQLHIGFALETNDEVANAKGKLQRKNLDMIVLNSLQDLGAGFGHDTNKITIIDKDTINEFALKPKADVAQDIAQEIIKKWRDLAVVHLQ
jgi:phosphopantothenoylcysteine decarboxylase / phosphopantothenate---cysteine ligase